MPLRTVATSDLWCESMPAASRAGACVDSQVGDLEQAMSVSIFSWLCPETPERPIRSDYLEFAERFVDLLSRRSRTSACAPLRHGEIVALPVQQLGERRVTSSSVVASDDAGVRARGDRRPARLPRPLPPLHLFHQEAVASPVALGLEIDARKCKNIAAPAAAAACDTPRCLRRPLQRQPPLGVARCANLSGCTRPCNSW